MKTSPAGKVQKQRTTYTASGNHLVRWTDVTVLVRKQVTHKVIGLQNIQTETVGPLLNNNDTNDKNNIDQSNNNNNNNNNNINNDNTVQTTLILNIITVAQDSDAGSKTENAATFLKNFETQVPYSLFHGSCSPTHDPQR